MVRGRSTEPGAAWQSGAAFARAIADRRRFSVDPGTFRRILDPPAEMWRALLFAVVVLSVGSAGAGCGDDPATTIEIDALGARWMAVRAAPDAAWERFDGENVRFDARGVFDVAVVCRDDIGDGFTIRATPDDGVTYHQICRYPGGVIPQFAITGSVTSIFVGVSASYLPNVVGQDIPPGTYDVVATQYSTQTAGTVERVQVLRDVVVDGTTPIPIDVDQFGLPPAQARVTIDGAPPQFAYVHGETANGTSFLLEGPMLVLPTELTQPTDRQIANVYDASNHWAEVAVHAGDNDVTLPPDTVDAAFSHVSPPSVTWTSTAAWDKVTFDVSAWTTMGANLPRWRLYAYAGAFTDHVEMPVPDLADWQARWMTDLSGPHVMQAVWDRARLDGGHGGVYKSEQQ
jgi:hypothetical protein